ncbi:MAG: efflux RND transporter permease subunit [Pseudomonadota bacterium]|nr:efflux RND transporter permease subunit [Pseudomonadota bacterium]
MPAPHLTPALRERFNISRVAIRHPVLTVAFWLALTAAGCMAAASLKYALFPDITYPVVVVHATALIDDAEQTEKQLTGPVEQAVRALRGTSDVSSTTSPGQVVVTVPFDVGSDLDAARRAVEASLRPLKLPEGTRTQVLQINLNEAVVSTYAVEASTLTLTRLGALTTEQIVPVIQALPGVLAVHTLGESRVPGKDPAAAPAGTAQAGTLVRLNGRTALAFQVVKRGDANTLDVADRVAAAVQQLDARLGAEPDRVRITQAQTQADYIRAATSQTLRALAEAVVISALVIFPFLWNWRATAISALAIPTSLLGTAIVMRLCGFNLETITLLALAMIVGNVVDDAIVDLENISRHIDMGQSPRDAAISATDEIGLTVTAATLTVVAVFLPIGLMSGVLGQFFRPFGITISAAMLISLLVSRTLSPVLAVYWLESSTAKAPRTSTGVTTACGHMAAPSALARHYGCWLAWSLGHRRTVLGVSALCFAASLALIPLIPNGFIPRLDRGEFYLNYSSPPVTPPEGPEAASFDPLQDSLTVAAKLDTFVRQSAAVETAFTIVGTRQGEPNKGSIHVQLKVDRQTATAAVQEQLRRGMPAIAGVSTSVEDIPFVDSGGDKPVQIRLVGDDLVSLQKTGQALTQRLKDIPGLTDITSSSTRMDGSTPLEIQHNNGRRVVLMTANLGSGASIGDVTDRAVAAARADLPPSIRIDLGGDSAQAEEIIGSFLKTLVLSMLCIFLVLYGLFRSLLDTVVVIASLPLCIVGALLGLLVTQADFGMVSMLGIIFLLGLTNKNAILIVDYIKQLRATGLPRREAIVQAAPIRLRPILMTTAATVLGMLPLALGFGAGAELRIPMAIAIMGGLITSTLLSLLVVPVVYDALAD